MYIVQGQQAQPQNLVRDVQVTEIGPRETLASRAVARFVDGPGIGTEVGALDVEAAGAGERGAVASHARWRDAIEEVNAASHALDQVLGKSNTHQVARP